MKQNLVLIFLIAMTNMAFAGDIYKCTINGAVVYQAKPCKGVGNKLDIPQAYNPKGLEHHEASPHTGRYLWESVYRING